jgi:hypothetical protein
MDNDNNYGMIDGTGLSVSDISISSIDAGYTDTITISNTGSITPVIVTMPDVGRRIGLRESGKIPIDIWSKLYNNGVIDDV